MAPLRDRSAWEAFLGPLRKMAWVVYSKPPFGGARQVLKYLARYTHRVAISNRRILSISGGKVRFLWKDYAHGSKQRTMELSAGEFIRRFLLHVIPRGFVRIRHFGFLANRLRTSKLQLARNLLGQRTEDPGSAPLDRSGDGVGVEKVVDVFLCPRCKQGRLVIVADIPAIDGPSMLEIFDSS
jgi:hypothetical protein